MIYFACVVEYMKLPASQYSVLDAERIVRVSEDTFRCYVYTIKFFTFEVCPVLLVKVEQQPHGCCIKLLSCKVTLTLTFPYLTVFLTFICLFPLSYRFLLYSLRARRWLPRRTISLMVRIVCFLCNCHDIQFQEFLFNTLMW